MGLLRIGLRSGSGLRWGFGPRSGFDLERRNAGPEEYNCATKQKSNVSHGARCLGGAGGASASGRQAKRGRCGAACKQAY